MINSTPTLCGFSPDVIPMQREVIDLVRKDWNFADGNLEILLSGSFGSSKSVLLAHLAATHALLNPGARVCLCRRGLPDLKKSILREVLNHIQDDMVEGVGYVYNRSESTIRFRNGSEMICMTWADGRYLRARSVNLSMVVIEEIIENSLEDKQAFDTLRARLRRIPGVAENLLIAATNPGSPSDWQWKYWLDPEVITKFPNRRVFYSLTEQNPFLDPIYIEGLRASMSKPEADRYLRGQWIDLRSKYIYYAYERERNYIDASYEPDLRYPICLSHDFNLSSDKPMSACLFQFVEGVFHVFADVVVDGFRTRDIMEEIQGRGLLDYKTKYYVHGDATGRHRDTRSKRSDYDIIENYLANETDLDFEISVPRANPPVRSRHNLVNALCCNDLGETHLFVYNGAKVVDEGLRLTSLKKGSGYVEDDSFRAQHVGNAVAYGIWRQTKLAKPKPRSTGTM